MRSGVPRAGASRDGKNRDGGERDRLGFRLKIGLASNSPSRARKKR